MATLETQHALADGDIQQMRAVAALSEKLELVLSIATCRICLELMPDACQLRCGHMFCQSCVTQLFNKATPVPCPLCMAPARKRGNRIAPVPMPQVVASLQRLQHLVTQADRAASTKSLPAPDVVTASHHPPSSPRAPRVDHLSAHDVALTPFSCEKTGRTGPINACALCPRGVDPATVAPKTELGELMSAGVKSRPGLRVHEECAFFASGVYKCGPDFVNVDLALRSSRSVLCSRELCGRDRATVRCPGEGCSSRYHYSCAVADGCSVVDDGSYAVFCPAHKDLAPVVNMDEFARNQVDPDGTQGRESPDHCVVCDVGGNLLLCDECDRAYHVVCAGLKALPVGQWYCEVCFERNRERNFGSAAGKDGLRCELPLEKRVMAGRPSLASGKSSQKRKRSTELPLRPLSQNLSDDAAEFSSRDANVYKPNHTKRRRGALIYVMPTALSPDARELLVAAQKKFRNKFAVENSLTKRVTHVVVNAHLPGSKLTRTVKLCKGIVSNLPIVCFKWVEDLISGSFRVPDVTDLHVSTRPSELGAPFAHKRFYFENLKGSSLSKEDLGEIVRAGKGIVVSSEPTVDSLHGLVRGTTYFVRCAEASFSSSRGRRNSLGPRVIPAGCQIVTPDWILDQCVRRPERANASETSQTPRQM